MLSHCVPLSFVLFVFIYLFELCCVVFFFTWKCNYKFLLSFFSSLFQMDTIFMHFSVLGDIIIISGFLFTAYTKPAISILFFAISLYAFNFACLRWWMCCFMLNFYFSFKFTFNSTFMQMLWCLCCGLFSFWFSFRLCFVDAVWLVGVFFLVS